MFIKKNGKINWFLFIRLFGVILFIIIITKINIDELWESIILIKIKYLLIAFFFQLVLLLSKGLRWHLLRSVDNQNYSLIFNLSTFFESYMIGVATPGRIGEFTKVGYENGKTGKLVSLLRIVSERGFDLGLFILIAGISFLFTNKISSNILIGSFSMTFSVLLICMSYLLLSNRKFINWILSILKKFARTRNLGDLTLPVHSPKSSGVILFLSIFGGLCHFISCYLLAVGLSFSISFLKVSGAVSIAGLLNLLPITIMGLGTREMTFIYFFNDFSSHIVLAFSVLVFFTAQIGGGLMAFVLSQIFKILSKNKY